MESKHDRISNWPYATLLLLALLALTGHAISIYENARHENVKVFLSNLEAIGTINNIENLHIKPDYIRNDCHDRGPNCYNLVAWTTRDARIRYSTTIAYGPDGKIIRKEQHEMEAGPVRLYDALWELRDVFTLMSLSTTVLLMIASLVSNFRQSKQK